jgi:lipoprotein-releasing system permease protein
MRQSDLEALHLVSNNIVAGSLDNFKGDDAVAIGVGLARRLSLRIGDRLTLVSPQGSATVIGNVPRIRAYTVVAVFQVGFNEADTSFVYLPLQAAQIFFKTAGGVTQIEVMVADPDDVSGVNREIRTALEGQPVRVIDWTQSNNSLFNAVQVERNVMFLILTLIIVVAAFNVISSLIMMVKDKTRDIAVLRTLGAGSGAVLRIFLMCGAFVGVAGTLAGALLGIAFCLNIERIRHVLESLTGTNLFNPEVYFLSQLPAVLDWREVTQVIVMALALSLLATLYPSWRAARTDPVEALRSE